LNSCAGYNPVRLYLLAVIRVGTKTDIVVRVRGRIVRIDDQTGMSLRSIVPVAATLQRTYNPSPGKDREKSKEKRGEYYTNP
jgi:hypothetical protein